MIGDLNSYAQEDPIKALESAGFVNLVEQLAARPAYSYVFDGQWGYLDHALASPALGPQVTGVAELHINADEPSVLDYNDDFKSAGQIASLYAADEFRVGDHDPMVVGLGLKPNLSGQATGAGWYDVSRRGHAQDAPGLRHLGLRVDGAVPPRIARADRRVQPAVPGRPAAIRRAIGGAG